MRRALGVAVLLLAFPALAQEPAPSGEPAVAPADSSLPPLPPPPPEPPPGPAVAPAPAESAAPPSPPPAEEAPPESPEKRARFKVEAGAEYRRLYDFGMGLGAVAFAFGSERSSLARYLRAEILGGRTEYGLTVFDFRFGGGAEWPIGRFRPGFYADIGLLSVERATESTSAKSLSLGITGSASFDILQQADGSALFVVGRFGVDMLAAFPWPLVWGPSAGLGYRF